MAQPFLQTAFNSDTPHFYNVLLRHKVTSSPFDNDRMRDYFCDVLLRNDAGLPLSVVAYAITGDNGQDARLVVAANDHAEGTVEIYTEWLIEMYEKELYNNILASVGRNFEPARVKKLHDDGAVVMTVNNVHASAFDRRYCSIGDYFGYGAGNAHTELMYTLYGDIFDQAPTLTHTADWIHEDPFFGKNPKKNTFQKQVERIAKENGILLKDYPPERLPLVFFEAINQTGCAFDDVVNVFMLNPAQREEIMFEMIRYYWENGYKCHQIVNSLRLPDFDIREYLADTLVKRGYIYEIVQQNFEIGKM